MGLSAPSWLAESPTRARANDPDLATRWARLGPKRAHHYYYPAGGVVVVVAAAAFGATRPESVWGPSRDLAADLLLNYFADVLLPLGRPNLLRRAGHSSTGPAINNQGERGS